MATSKKAGKKKVGKKKVGKTAGAKSAGEAGARKRPGKETAGTDEARKNAGTRSAGASDARKRPGKESAGVSGARKKTVGKSSSGITTTDGRDTSSGTTTAEVVVAGQPSARRRRSFVESARPARQGPVREAEGFVRETASPVSALAAASGGHTGLAGVLGGKRSVAPRRSRRGVVVPTLEELAAGRPPRSNDERNLLIATARELGGAAAGIAEFRADYARLGWRVPANLANTLRLSVRRGVLRRRVDGSYVPA